jgi:hypothetical protein
MNGVTSDGKGVTENQGRFGLSSRIIGHAFIVTRHAFRENK